MSFSYSASLASQLDNVRFDIGDTVSGAGVMPDGSNIPDETINAVIAAQGSVGKASVYLARRISARWKVIASSMSVGGRSESNNQADAFERLAVVLAEQYGIGSGSLSAGVISLDFAEKDTTNTSVLVSEL